VRHDGSVAESQDKVGQRNAWNRVAPAYVDFWSARLADYTARGLDLVDLGGAGDGLDIACGPGHSTAALGERVRGRVLGVDFAPEMVELAREVWRDRPGLEFAVDDAERLSLPDASRDVVSSSFGLMYLYEPAAGIAHMARVLRPGGHLVLVVWGRAARVWWSPVIELVETRASYFSGVCPMIFFYGLPGVLARMLQDAGLEVGPQEVITEPMRFASVEEAVDAATIGGPLQGLFVHRLSDEGRAEVREALREHVGGVAERTGDGVALTSEVAVVTARRPTG
jgi:ubiquinone/menaquinone biosynthesis C-methylase UbiE